MKALEQQLNDFMNSTRWTGDIFKPHEKIECSILLQVEEATFTDSKTNEVTIIENRFIGTLTIQSSRPVFNSDYKTTILNWKDQDLVFTYKENDPIDYNENIYNNNLVHVFAYYANIIIGLDYSTYSLNGGTPYFSKAENLLQLASNSDDGGWKNNINQRNRFTLVTDLLAPKFKAFHEAMYTYHLKGLDVMYDDPVKGRAAVSDAITNLNTVNNAQANSVLVQLFGLSKSNEIALMFESVDRSVKEPILKTMSRIDITNGNKYQDALIKGGGKP